MKGVDRIPPTCGVLTFWTNSCMTLLSRQLERPKIEKIARGTENRNLAVKNGHHPCSSVGRTSRVSVARVLEVLRYECRQDLDFRRRCDQQECFVRNSRP